MDTSCQKKRTEEQCCCLCPQNHPGKHREHVGTLSEGRMQVEAHVIPWVHGEILGTVIMTCGRKSDEGYVENGRWTWHTVHIQSCCVRCLAQKGAPPFHYV